MRAHPRVRNHCSMSLAASAIAASSSPKRPLMCASHPTTGDTFHSAANHRVNACPIVASCSTTPASHSAASYPAMADANLPTEAGRPTHMQGRAARWLTNTRRLSTETGMATGGVKETESGHSWPAAPGRLATSPRLVLRGRTIPRSERRRRLNLLTLLAARPDGASRRSSRR